MNPTDRLIGDIHERGRDVRQVSVVLAVAHEQGRDFDSAWYSALRSLVVDSEVAPDAKGEEVDTKQVLAETKGHWRAAYEGRLPSASEAAQAMRLATERLHDLIEFDANGASANGQPG